MRIGVLGGTFDPIHKGHLALAEAALSSLNLDEVLFVPANRNPLKTGRRQASARDRMEMVRIATADDPRFAVSDIEIQRGGPSYAVETLRELNQARPAEYWFLLGSDAVKDIGTWRQPEKLLRLCRLGVAVRRPESWENVLSRLKPEYRPYLDPVALDPIDVSASEIRDRLAKKEAVGVWLPAKVLQYIRERHLYES